MDLRVGYIFKNRVREGCLRSWQQRGSGGGWVGVRASPVSIKKKGTVLTTQGHNGSEGAPGPAQQWTVVQSARDK